MSTGRTSGSFTVERKFPQALAEYDKIPDQDKAVTAENQFVASSLGWVYAVSGRRADALKIAKEFRDLSSHAYVDFYIVAGIYAGLGDKDEPEPDDFATSAVHVKRIHNTTPEWAL